MKSRNRAAQVAIAVLLVISFAGPTTATDGAPPPVTECDRLTAHPEDPQRVAPEIAFEEIEPRKAIAACRAALEDYPGSPRLVFQLGRAIDASGKPAEAATYYEKAAEKNYPAAHYSLFLHLTGDLSEPRINEGLAHLERAVELGHDLAQLKLAIALADGDFGAKDLDRAVALLEPLAERDNIDAQSYLGGLILREGGRLGDVSDARDWLERAAANDDLDALLFLADLYRQGQPFGHSPQKSEAYGEKAATLLEPLAKTDDPKAQFTLAEMHAVGLGVVKNPSQAFSWYHRAAELGLAEAQYKVGLAYLLGRGTRVNDAEAFQWLHKSAVAGHRPARQFLAKQYGSCLMSKEPTGFLCESQDKALAWIRKYAEAGDPHAAFVLGIAYDRGLRVPQDPEKAREWFEISRKNGLN